MLTTYRTAVKQLSPNGRLPARPANRTFGGPGSGVTCAVYGEPVASNQMELEIEFNRHGATPGLDRWVPGRARRGPNKEIEIPRGWRATLSTRRIQTPESDPDRDRVRPLRRVVAAR